MQTTLNKDKVMKKARLITLLKQYDKDGTLPKNATAEEALFVKDAVDISATNLGRYPEGNEVAALSTEVSKTLTKVTGFSLGKSIKATMTVVERAPHDLTKMVVIRNPKTAITHLLIQSLQVTVSPSVAKEQEDEFEKFCKRVKGGEKDYQALEDALDNVIEELEKYVEEL